MDHARGLQASRRDALAGRRLSADFAAPGSGQARASPAAAAARQVPMSKRQGRRMFPPCTGVVERLSVSGADILSLSPPGTHTPKARRPPASPHGPRFAVLLAALWVEAPDSMWSVPRSVANG